MREEKFMMNHELVGMWDES